MKFSHFTCARYLPFIVRLWCCLYMELVTTAPELSSFFCSGLYRNNSNSVAYYAISLARWYWIYRFSFKRKVKTPWVSFCLWSVELRLHPGMKGYGLLGQWGLKEECPSQIWANQLVSISLQIVPYKTLTLQRAESGRCWWI